MLMQQLLIFFVYF